MAGRAVLRGKRLQLRDSRHPIRPSLHRIGSSMPIAAKCSGSYGEKTPLPYIYPLVIRWARLQDVKDFGRNDVL